MALSAYSGLVLFEWLMHSWQIRTLQLGLGVIFIGTRLNHEMISNVMNPGCPYQGIVKSFQRSGLPR
jgi:hypothetical protein